MTDKTVRVTADWALWGKAKKDIEYRLLSWSDGAVSEDNFAEVVTRYSPGTLELVPQVTISWLFDSKGSTHYLAIAIHDAVKDRDAPDGSPGRLAAAGAESAPAPVDARGRPTVLTRYFCVPFRELAAGAIPYRALYRAFSAAPLPVERRDRLLADLPAAPPAGLRREFAAHAPRAAAALLTGRPVCIVGARYADVNERLLFLDSVASLLPYGLRSRLSASTWAVSSYEEHRIRLFFSSAARRSDIIIEWAGGPDASPLGDRVADDYLAWLQYDDNIGPRIAYLATLTDEMEFNPADFARMQKLIGSYRSRRGKTNLRDQETQEVAAPPQPRYSPPAPIAPAPAAPALLPGSPTPSRNVEQLLRSCMQDLEVGPIAALRELSYSPTAAGDQLYYQELIKECRLLCEDRPASRATRPETERLRRQLYLSLIPLAFGRPLTYDGFCRIEYCAACPAEQLPHSSLLLAVDSSELDDRFMSSFIRLLTLAATDGQPPETRPPGNSPTPGSLIRLAAERELRPRHARMVWAALHARSGPEDRPALQQALKEAGYLTQDPRQWYPGAPEDQVTVLSHLLRVAYGSPLDPAAVRDILGRRNRPPAEALSAAIRISTPGYGAANRAILKRLLPPPRAKSQSAAPDPPRKPAPPGTSAAPPGAVRAPSKVQVQRAAYFIFFGLICAVGIIAATWH